MNFVSFVLIFKGKETYFVFHIFVLLFTKLFQLIQECKTSLISHFLSLGSVMGSIMGSVVVSDTGLVKR